MMAAKKTTKTTHRKAVPAKQVKRPAGGELTPQTAYAQLASQLLDASLALPRSKREQLVDSMVEIATDEERSAGERTNATFACVEIDKNGLVAAKMIVDHLSSQQVQPDQHKFNVSDEDMLKQAAKLLGPPVVEDAPEEERVEDNVIGFNVEGA